MPVEQFDKKITFYKDLDKNLATLLRETIDVYLEKGPILPKEKFIQLW